jgi:1-acyl-sn-glycerol-3-phosphate acyltransferase
MGWSADISLHSMIPPICPVTVEGCRVNYPEYEKMMQLADGVGEPEQLDLPFGDPLPAGIEPEEDEDDDPDVDPEDADDDEDEFEDTDDSSDDDDDDDESVSGDEPAVKDDDDDEVKAS